MKQVLIIDDDREMCELLADYLAQEGFTCRFSHDGKEGLKLALSAEHDILILDVMLPGESGFVVLQQLRSAPATAALPVIMLTAKGSEVDRVVGLEMGADDYLAKPFSPRELVARMRAVLRRLTPSVGGRAEGIPSVQTVGDITYYSQSMRVQVRGEEVRLTALEFRLLQMLLEQPGSIVSREEISRTLLGHTLYPFERSVDMHISRIRKKLGPRPGGEERIRAVRGEGYVYLTAEEAS